MKPSSDVFRPRLPSDPFVDLDVDQPWHFASDSDAQLFPPRVILVFGAPSQADLRTLLTSPWLSDSLVLIATHAPPSWNGQPVPTVRILRLSNPLEEEGGRELASLFDRAERLANYFRCNKLPFSEKRFAQLAEKFPGGDFTVLEDYTAGHVAGANRHPSATPSNPTKLKRISVVSNTSTILRAPSIVQSQQRAFDAVLHFIPASLSEKDIYKRAILVTTLSVSFLSTPPSHHHTDPTPKRRFSPLLRHKQRQSLFLSSDSAVAATPAVYRSHLVHILPKPPPPLPASPRNSLSSQPFLARHLSPNSTSKPSSSVKLHASSAFYIPPLDSDPSSSHSRSHHPSISAPLQSRGASHRQGSFSTTAPTSGRKKLAQSIEYFLVQFAHPSASSRDDSRSVPYLVSPGIFSSAVRMQGNGNVVATNETEALVCEGRLMVGEAVLLGLLDAPAKGDDTCNVPKNFGRLGTRAWIAENQDVAMLQTNPGKPCDNGLTTSLPPPPPTPLTNVATPAPTHSNGKQMERGNAALREDSFVDGQIMQAILSPHPYPSFQNTPLPWASFGTGSQPDESVVKKPAPIVPRVHAPLSPPLSTATDLDSKHAVKRDSAPIETILPASSDDSPLPKLAVETEPSVAETDATGSVSSHMAKTASTDHSWPGASGLLTPPESTSSSESCGASEYESCELFSVTEHGASMKMVAEERGSGPFILFHPSPTADADRWRKTDPIEAVKEAGGLSLTGRIGHQFRRLTKVMSLSSTAASAVSAMAISTGSPKHRLSAARERNVLHAVVV